MQPLHHHLPPRPTLAIVFLIESLGPSVIAGNKMYGGPIVQVWFVVEVVVADF